MNKSPQSLIDISEERRAYQVAMNQIADRAGRARIDRTISDTFYGHNITTRNSGIALNTENHGYTFFTRPCMNMSYNNLVVDRVMSNLVNESSHSLARMIRATLDPKLEEREKISISGIDPKGAFIPLLSNNLISLTGFTDLTLNTHMSQPGLYREVYGYTDDVPYNYGAYDLTATFRNLEGDPITFMMLMWCWYQGLVFEGTCWPYPEFIVDNAVDYQTRIYRLVMDNSRTYVTRIGATGVSWPITAPVGNIFNFEGDGSNTPFATANDQIAINFRTLGFTYYDNLLVYEFNKTVSDANPDMADAWRQRRHYKLRPNEREYFNNRAYPYINPLTMELEWWVTKEVFNSVLKNLETEPSQQT